MKASLIALSVVSLTSLLVAQPAPESLNKPAASQQARTIDPAARSNMLAKTGGLIQSAASGPAFLFLDTQKQLPEATLREVTGQIQKILRLSCTLTTKTVSDPVAVAVKALSDTNVAAVIVIGDSAGYPSLLVAPEARWALVNVAALTGDGKVTKELLAERTQKEVWRAFGYLMGAANSSFEHCLLKPVFSPADLDELKPKSLCPEPFNKIMTQAQKLGMKPARMTTYRKAVEEGWAPAPTNDVQKAIWDELKGSALVR